MEGHWYETISGSNVNIESIDLSKSKPNKDFGKGFYLSGNENKHLQWQVKR